MIVFELNGRSARDNTQYGLVYVVETLVNGQWVAAEKVEVNSGTVQAKRNFLLDDNQRLVVDRIRDNSHIVYNKAQKSNNAIPPPQPPRSPPRDTLFSTERTR